MRRQKRSWFGWVVLVLVGWTGVRACAWLYGRFVVRKDTRTLETWVDPSTIEMDV